MSSPSLHPATSPVRLPRVELYRLLADPDRLRILSLCAEEELSVGELSLLLTESQPQVSRKAAPLRQAGLLKARRDGTRTWLKSSAAVPDPVLADALKEGKRLCLADGSLSRIPGIVSAREESGLALFEAAKEPSPSLSKPPSSAHFAHLAALSPLLPGRDLAIDVGTGEGQLLDVLAPLYQRVIAVDRSRARLARCAAHVAQRGFHHVSLFPGTFDEPALIERVDAAGGANLVFASRTVHHASRPAQAIASFARLLRPGGHLVILDYLPHQDEALRQEQGDVWLGIAPEELVGSFEAAGLQPSGEATISPSFHREGPDAHLTWHAVVAQKLNPKGQRAPN